MIMKLPGVLGIFPSGEGQKVFLALRLSTLEHDIQRLTNVDGTISQRMLFHCELFVGMSCDVAGVDPKHGDERDVVVVVLIHVDLFFVTTNMIHKIWPRCETRVLQSVLSCNGRAVRFRL